MKSGKLEGNLGRKIHEEFWWGIFKLTDILDDLGVDEKIVFKRILK
jgi:hypothetical protein